MSCWGVGFGTPEEVRHQTLAEGFMSMCITDHGTNLKYKTGLALEKKGCLNYKVPGKG